jgi:hypothetical protein
VSLAGFSSVFGSTFPKLLGDGQVSCRVGNLSHKKVYKKRDVERPQGSFVRRACELLVTLVLCIGAMPIANATTECADGDAGDNRTGSEALAR